MFTLRRIQASISAVAIACLGSGAGVALASTDREIDVKVQIIGEEIRANASVFVPAASQQRVWDVLTDFERAPEFTRDLQVSRVVARSGDTLRLLQRRQVRVGPLAFPVETVREIRLTPPVKTESRLISGSLKKYDSTTEVVPEAGGTRILFRSTAIPGGGFGGLVTESAVKRETEERFRQLRAEILRREHVAGARQQHASGASPSVQ